MNEIIVHTQSEQLGELFGALSKAQKDIKIAAKDKKNPFFKSQYADLQSVWDACRDALSKQGLAVIQNVQASTCESGFEMVTMLGHSSGQWIKSCCPMSIAKKDAQGMGSAITYYRRYLLSSMVGVVAGEDDDDGNAACEPADVKPELISKQQNRELNELIAKDANPSEGLKLLLQSQNVPSLDKIPAASYNKLVKAMNNRLANQMKEQAQLVEEPDSKVPF